MAVDPNQFKDSGGRFLTQGLFYEYRFHSSTDHPPRFNLKEHDWNGTQSMYKLYMNSISEYDFVYNTLGSMKLWKMLCGTRWFKPHVTKWRAEKEEQIEALALQTLIEQAQQGNVSAAKELLKLNKKAGRPSEKLKKQAAKKLAEEDKETLDIFNRIVKDDGTGNKIN